MRCLFLGKAEFPGGDRWKSDAVDAIRFRYFKAVPCADRDPLHGKSSRRHSCRPKGLVCRVYDTFRLQLCNILIRYTDPIHWSEETDDPEYPHAEMFRAASSAVCPDGFHLRVC